MVRLPLATTLLAALWIGGVAIGVWSLETYKSRPGNSGDTPGQWPEDVQAAALRPRLLMFIHPHCPCTAASLHELERIATNVENTLAIQVLCVKPTGVDDAWVRTPSWYAAGRIPGATVTCDEGGVLAQQFGAQTSGQAPAPWRPGPARTSTSRTSTCSAARTECSPAC